MNTLSDFSTELRKKAFEILNELNLVDFLSKNYGETYVVGSVELDLMVWRDIDLETITKEIPSRDDAIKVADFIYKNKNVRKVNLIDYLDGDGIKKPKGQYIGVEFVENGNKWKIDVWLLDRESSRSNELTKNIKDKLTPETREYILNIKNDLYEHPKYRKDFLSVDIYNSVIESNIKSTADFKKFLLGKGIIL